MSGTNGWHELRTRLGEIDDLHSAGSLLHWDQATMMPSGGATARARQCATLSRLAHEKGSDPALGDLLDQLDGRFESDDDRALWRAARREFERARKIPNDFEARFSNHVALIYDIWTRARPEGDFALVQPLLRTSLELSLELSSFLGGDHPADPLIDWNDPGYTVTTLRPLFAELRALLRPLVADHATRQSAPRPSPGGWPLAAQRELVRRVVEAVGYDFTRGRIDESPHPFMTKFSLDDVRITTRWRADDPLELLSGALHEAGHALYEQGIDARFEATPLAQGVSSGVHESQSRLWENGVGRTQAFWEWLYPHWRAAFPEAHHPPLDQWMATVNRVHAGPIRVDADELHYNLHVILRFDLECDLLEGRLDVGDLPDAWNERVRQDLGVEVANDRDGVLQDVHWFAGSIGGAFQGYALGNVLSAQLLEAARAALPDLDQAHRVGNFAPLRQWLRENIHRHGNSLTPSELIQRATGSPLGLDAYARYLQNRFAVA